MGLGVTESMFSGQGSWTLLREHPTLWLPLGTRNAVLNTEARTIDADVLSRRCVLMRLLDFSYEQYQKALRQLAGAVVIILPRAMAAVPQDVIRVSPRSPPSVRPGSRSFCGKGDTGFGAICVASHFPEPLGPCPSGSKCLLFPFIIGSCPPGVTLQEILGNLWESGCHNWGCFWHQVDATGGTIQHPTVPRTGPHRE